MRVGLSPTGATTQPQLQPLPLLQQLPPIRPSPPLQPLVALQPQPKLPSQSPPHRHHHLTPNGPRLHTPATAVFATWLSHCATSEQRCSCLQHGAPEGSVEFIRRFPSVAFFLIVPEQAITPGTMSADRLVADLDAHNASNAYVMRMELTRLGARPLSNGVLNPHSRHLTALQALQASNEFFDLQIIHTSAVQSIRSPTAAQARSLLSLAAATLVILLPGPSRHAWHDVIPHFATHVSPSADPIAAAAEIDVEIMAEGCSPDGGGGGADGGGGGSADYDGGYSGGGGVECSLGSADALLLRLNRLSRLNFHHLSCWDAPRCHDRMYVMTMDKARVVAGHGGSGSGSGGDDNGAGWWRRVPALHRVERVPGAPPGQPSFASLAGALPLRGKAIPFQTGGANLDSLVRLQLAARHRARLASDFLRIPVGRDMMLWNIVAGHDGAYAIDQEGMVYADGQVPWERRAMPYCLSVRDCYEKPLGALCGLPYSPPGRLYGDALTAAAAELFAGRCGRERPYPCANGCQPSYEMCVRGEQPTQASVETDEAEVVAA